MVEIPRVVLIVALWVGLVFLISFAVDLVITGFKGRRFERAFWHVVATGKLPPKEKAQR